LEEERNKLREIVDLHKRKEHSVELNRKKIEEEQKERIQKREDKFEEAKNNLHKQRIRTQLKNIKLDNMYCRPVMKSGSRMHFRSFC